MPHWIAYAPARREFEAADAIAALGVTVHVPRKVELIRSGKRRWPDMVESPILPNYLFLDMTDHQWHQVAAVPKLRLTFMACGRGEWARVTGFIDAARAAYDAAKFHFAAGERISEFTAGDAMEILGGHLVGRMATFRRIVERPDAAFPMVEGEIQMMGRAVPVTLDPVMVRKA